MIEFHHDKKLAAVAAEIGHDVETVRRHLIYGDGNLYHHAGRDYVQMIKGGRYKRRRSEIYGYVHRKSSNGEPFVLATDEDPKLAYARRYGSKALVESYARNVKYVIENGGPMVPDVEYYDTKTVPLTLNTDTLAVDTEGRDRIFRFSASWFDGLWHAVSLPWNAVSHAWLKRVVGQVEHVAFWMASHDVALLAKEGITVPDEKVHDAMHAHQILNPWCRRALSYAAPLYGCFEPWKYKWELDSEAYSMMDAFVTARLWERMKTLLVETRQRNVYLTEREFQRLMPFEPKPTWEKDENEVTKAAGMVEGELWQ